MIIKNNNTHIHFVGIGGIGMSALAEVSLQLGFRVTGSDLNESLNVEKLRRKFHCSNFWLKNKTA